MTEIQQYPGFEKLKEMIHSNLIEPPGVSRSLAADLREAQEKLSSVKKDYFQYLHLYNVLEETLVDQNHGIPRDSLSEMIAGEEDNAYKIASNLLFNAEAKHCLKINVNSNLPPEEGNLFGLSQSDFDIHPQRRRVQQQNVQAVLIPEIEKKMKMLSLEIYRLVNPASEGSEGLALAKANKLHLHIRNEKKKMQQVKETVQEQQLVSEKMYREHYNDICRKVAELSEKLSGNNTSQRQEAKQVAVDWLITKCNFIHGKVKVMRNRLYLETYTKENIAALKKVEAHLSKKITKKRVDIQQTQKSLGMYESVGGSAFTKLMTEYTQLVSEIDNKKWALAELKSSGGAIVTSS